MRERSTPPTLEMLNALDDALAAVGGAGRLAELLNITSAAISNWRLRPIPPDRALIVETLTGISKHRLRPDLWKSEETTT